MATGEMVMQMTDFELPALLPVVMERIYSSAYGVGRWFGPSWSSFLDQRLEVDEQGVCFAYTEAVLLTYPTLEPGESALPDEGPRLPLSRRADGAYSVHEPETGRTFWFAPPPDEPRVVLPLAGISDRNSNRIDLGYDPVTGWLAEIDHTGGYRVQVDCEAGQITEFRLTGRDGASDTTIIRYAYDDYGRLTDVINSSGLPLKFGYDRHNRITSWTDRNGTWYRYQYDGEGRVIRTSGSAHCLDGEMRYDSANRVTVEVNSQEAETTYHYNEAGQVERVVDPLSHVTSHTWDRYHRKTSETDALGRRTRWTYDENDDLIMVTRPDGLAIRTTYDDHHRPASEQQPDGGQWRQEHDRSGNLLSVTDPAGATTRYERDNRGGLSRLTDPLGNTTQIVCDAAGLPIRITDPIGNTVLVERDGFGRVSSLTDPAGGVTRYRWTVEGDLAEETRPDGASESWRYDPERNLLEHVGPLGQTTSFERTFFDLPAVRRDGAGGTVAFTYDTELRLTSVTDPGGRVWLYAYDRAGHLIGESDYEGRELTYSYDVAGQLLERRNGAGEWLRLTRDALGMVVRNESEFEIASMEYDAMGRLRRAVNRSAEVTFERDLAGRVVAETVDGRQTRSRYDAVGRRVWRALPSGAQSRWQYDSVGRLASYVTGESRLDFSYDAAGREIGRSLNGRTFLRQTWDSGARLLSQTIMAPGGDPARTVRRSYVYQQDGLVSGLADVERGISEYALDVLGQVRAVRRGHDEERYAYRADGHVVSDRRGDSFDRQGRLIRRVGVEGIDQQQFSWDASDRLREFSQDGKRWVYHYDALGRRIAKSEYEDSCEVPVTTTAFIWDGPHLAEQVTAAKTLTWHRAPHSFTSLGHSRSDGSSQRASFVALVTDVAGLPAEFVDTQRGLARAEPSHLWSGVSADTQVPDRYPGQFFDEESGLHYNFARYYDPRTAGYISLDPLGIVADLNPSRYAVNPTAFGDPLGLAPYRIHASSAYQDYGVKGAHVHLDPGGKEVRIYPRHDGTIGASPIRMSHTGVPDARQMQAALDAVHQDPKLRADLISKTRSAMEAMNAGAYGMNRNRGAEMYFLIKALEKL